VAPEAQKSLLLADRVWHEEGCPSDAARLGAVLEKILRRCIALQNLVCAGAAATQESAGTRHLAATRRGAAWKFRHSCCGDIGWRDAEPVGKLR